MSKSFVEEGRRYRWVAHDGKRWLLSVESSKLTLYSDYGIVKAGPGYSYTLPNGKVMEGYTDEPVFVQAYQEMWAEGAADFEAAQGGTSP